MTINISKTNESLDHGGEVGTFVIRVIGENEKKTERMQLSSRSKYYEPGSTHTMVMPGDVVGKPEAVEISWEYRTSVFNPLTWRLLHTPRVYIDSLTIESLESAHGYVILKTEYIIWLMIKRFLSKTRSTVDYLFRVWNVCVNNFGAR